MAFYLYFSFVMEKAYDSDNRCMDTSLVEIGSNQMEGIIKLTLVQKRASTGRRNAVVGLKMNPAPQRAERPHITENVH